jgi:hypothetical protein
LTIFSDGQNIFWTFFNLFSKKSIWLLLILQVITAILPDLIIKVYENQRDSGLVKKAKRKDARRLDRTKKHSNEMTNINYEFDTLKPRMKKFLLY